MTLNKNLIKSKSLFRYSIPALSGLCLILFLKFWNDAFQIISPLTIKFMILFFIFFSIATCSWLISLQSLRFRQFINNISGLKFPIFWFMIIILLFNFTSLWFMEIKNNYYFLLTLILSTFVMMSLILLGSKKSLKIAINFACFAVSTVLSLGMVEIIFQNFLVEHKVPVNENDFNKWISSAWLQFIPMQKDSNVFRILGLSDSFGRAGGHQNYHYLIEKMLKLTNANYEIVNLSGEAYDPPDELILFSRFGARYKPDMIIHGFFIGNDFNTPTGNLLSYKGITLRSADGWRSLLPHNYIFLRYIYRYLKVLHNKSQKNKEKSKAQLVGNFSYLKFMAIERECLEICRIHPIQDKRINQTLQILEKIHKKAKETGAKYMVVLHPDQFQVEKSLFLDIIHFYNLDSCDYEVARPQKILTNFFQAKNVPCIDLLPVFKNHGAKGGLYLFRDTHYNLKGNQLAAQAIYEYLQQNLL